jgi:hypothetical protein
VASDLQSDGHGIETHLSTGRLASTRGHAAPYTDKESGNLPVGHAYAGRSRTRPAGRRGHQWS